MNFNIYILYLPCSHVMLYILVIGKSSEIEYPKIHRLYTIVAWQFYIYHRLRVFLIPLWKINIFFSKFLKSLPILSKISISLKLCPIRYNLYIYFTYTLVWKKINQFKQPIPNISLYIKDVPLRKCYKLL